MSAEYSVCLAADWKCRQRKTGGAVSIAPYTAYLSMKTETDVHIMPGTSREAIGRLQEGQPAIATGEDRQWLDTDLLYRNDQKAIFREM